MVSYEIAMGMSLIPVLLLAGNVSLNAIVLQQASSLWNAANLTLAFFIFLVAAFAETNRLPFDLPEAEAELITGYHTEYGAMKFSFFFIAEYANMLTASALMATLFLGGWDIPFTLADNLGPWSWWMMPLSLVIFGVKVVFFLFLFMWIRWTLPRFRYDQLMSLGWKFMLPLALAYIVIVAVATLALDYGAGYVEALRLGWVRGLILLALNAVLCVLVFALLDRGRVISPASRRAREEELLRLRSISRQRSTLAPGMGD
jgi:NADH-quinone oxidoreductase subunit H